MPRVIASFGHASAQIPQPVHLEEFNTRWETFFRRRCSMMIVSPSTFVENFGNIVLIAITISSL
jgi:hypothetical protein